MRLKMSLRSGNLCSSSRYSQELQCNSPTWCLWTKRTSRTLNSRWLKPWPLIPLWIQEPLTPPQFCSSSHSSRSSGPPPSHQDQAQSNLLDWKTKTISYRWPRKCKISTLWLRVQLQPRDLRPCRSCFRMIKLQNFRHKLHSEEWILAMLWKDQPSREWKKSESLCTRIWLRKVHLTPICAIRSSNFSYLRWPLIPQQKLSIKSSRYLLRRRWRSWLLLKILRMKVSIRIRSQWMAKIPRLQPRTVIL